MHSKSGSDARAFVGRKAGISRVVYVASFLGLLGLAACTTTITPGGGDSCGPDNSVSCPGGGTGYSCDGSDIPEDANPDLVCSADQGNGAFCCFVDSACAYSASVTARCGGTGAYGYTCNGGTPPDASDPSLLCSEPTGSDYCCFTEVAVSGSTSTCAQDDSVAGCAGGSYGFSCTGSDAPDADFSNLTCSDGVATGSDTVFCCTYK